MITSTTNYTGKIKMDRKNPREMVKALLCRQCHSKKHTLAHSQKDKGKKKIIYIYLKKKGRE